MVIAEVAVKVSGRPLALLGRSFALLALGALLATACGGDARSVSDSPPADGSPPPVEESPPAGDDGSADVSDAAGSDVSPAPDEAEAADRADVGFVPVRMEHAFGTTVIESMPQRVATVQWANHEVPLALGVVPVGMARITWGDDDGDGLLPWVKERLDELGAEVPVLFDETDGIDFEAVADTDPDVILAAYSGLSQEDYDTLSAIAPVVAYPVAPWITPWRDMVRLNSMGMGMGAEGEALIARLEQEIAAAAAGYPQLVGKSAMFLSHTGTTDLSEIGFYTTLDQRVQFLGDLGFGMASAVVDASAGGDAFFGPVSAEQIHLLDDVDIIVAYGYEGGELRSALEADPLTSRIPALAQGSVVFFPSGPISAAINPSPLSVPWILDDLLALLAEAADKVE